MKDRTDRLFEAIEHPDRFSDDEIQEMLNDPGMQELYKQICKTADALTTTEYRPRVGTVCKPSEKICRSGLTTFPPGIL